MTIIEKIDEVAERYGFKLCHVNRDLRIYSHDGDDTVSVRVEMVELKSLNGKGEEYLEARFKR